MGPGIAMLVAIPLAIPLAMLLVSPLAILNHMGTWADLVLTVQGNGHVSSGVRASYLLVVHLSRVSQHGKVAEPEVHCPATVVLLSQPCLPHDVMHQSLRLEKRQLFETHQRKTGVHLSGASTRPPFLSNVVGGKTNPDLLSLDVPSLSLVQAAPSL